MLCTDVPLRTKRALWTYTLYSDSTHLVLNGILLITNNALQAHIHKILTNLVAMMCTGELTGMPSCPLPTFLL